MEDDGDRYLTVTEAAYYLGVSELTVRRRIRDGKLSAVNVDGLLRVRKYEVDEYMEDR